jgi:hypothetical protein
MRTLSAPLVPRGWWRIAIPRSQTGKRSARRSSSYTLPVQTLSPSITFTVNSVDEYLEQVHIFAEEITVPFRRNHDLSMSGHTEAMGSRLVNQENT